MGRWVNWTVSEDLTTDEIAAVASEIERVVKSQLPAVAAAIDAERAAPRNFLQRVYARHMSKSAHQYASDPTSVTATETEAWVLQTMHGARHVKVPFQAGAYGVETVGFQDYALLGTLGVISSVTGKLALDYCDDLEPDELAACLARFTGLTDFPFDGFRLDPEAPVIEAPTLDFP